MQKFSNKAKGGVVLMIILVAVFVWINFSGGSTPSTPSVQHLSIGDQGFIAASTTVGVSKDAYDAYFKAASASDAVGFYQLKESGQIYDLTAKTKVLVIDSTWGDDQVRFLDGSRAGQTAWIGYETVLAQ